MRNAAKAARTVKIRIAIAVDADGNWQAGGASGMSDNNMMQDLVLDCADELSGTHQQYFLTVEVPLPKPIELTTTAPAVEVGEFVQDQEEDEMAAA